MSSLENPTPPFTIAARRLCLARAWRGLCPQCGAGRLFASYARLQERCSACGLIYRREQGAMTGSMYLSAIVTEIFAALIVLAIFFGTSWSVRTSLLVSVPLVLAFALFWLPRAMALWVAIEYATDLGNRESWIHFHERHS